MFDRGKLEKGISKALEKRPLFDQVKEITGSVESRLRLSKTKEVSSKVIGRMVLSALKGKDKIAYLRFASVYKKFEDPSDFAKVITTLEKKL